MAQSHNLGFPRIGKKRELKKAVEAYWSGAINEGTLQVEAQKIRSGNWEFQANAGLDWLPAGDFSLYDHVLDTSVLLGVVPERFGIFASDIDDNTYFRMARGRAPEGKDVRPCEMTKWFDTNYHYIVPEFNKNQEFKIQSQKLFREVAEAQKVKSSIKPVLLGPLTYLWLGKTIEKEFDKLILLPELLRVYSQIFSRLYAQNITWLQIEEPLLALDLPENWRQAFAKAYETFADTPLSLLLTTYFNALEDNVELACRTPVKGVHIDVTHSSTEIYRVAELLPQERVLSVGVIDGRNIWRSSLQKEIKLLQPLQEKFDTRLWIACSCSLLHCPVDLNQEKKMDKELKNWLAFSIQKIEEVVLLTRALNEGEKAIKNELAACNRALEQRQKSEKIHRLDVQQRCKNISNDLTQRKSPYSQRRIEQNALWHLPLLPTTTIGSFPQTEEVRLLHRNFKAKLLTEDDYRKQIQQHITKIIQWQENIDLDVLVHGEVERSDMVEYFGSLLEGFAITEGGWVQSYGSRCVKPPIIFGDVSRDKPMTVEWIRFAQSLTPKPVKGMLTGPITLIRWSFIRDDLSPFEIGKQIAMALRDEVSDLEEAGIKIIQIDEPAFREGAPLRQNLWKNYFEEAITCFRLASSVVANQTQIHTHMCYSEFNQIIEAIAELDADVISIEASRSDMELLQVFKTFHYPNEIGPGVYDIHSPHIPEVDSIVKRIEKATDLIPIQQLWVNPDCGLKTRTWPETQAALTNMIAATKTVRKKMLACSAT